MGLAEPGWAVEEERVVGLGWSLGNRQSSRVGDPVPLADHEAVEGVVDIEIRVRAGARGPGKLARVLEADLGQLGSDTGQGLAQQPGIAPLDPGVDALGGREVEHPGLGTDDRERLQPKLKRGWRYGRSQASLNVRPEGIEILFRRVVRHQRPTIAATRRAETGRPANPEESLRGPREGPSL